jgi:hypothetical protein
VSHDYQVNASTFHSLIAIRFATVYELLTRSEPGPDPRS